MAAKGQNVCEDMLKLPYCIILLLIFQEKAWFYMG